MGIMADLCRKQDERRLYTLSLKATTNHLLLFDICHVCKQLNVILVDVAFVTMSSSSQSEVGNYSSFLYSSRHYVSSSVTSLCKPVCKIPSLKFVMLYRHFFYALYSFLKNKYLLPTFCSFHLQTNSPSKCFGC